MEQLNMDMLSDLPEDLLLHILSYLPIQDIISTSHISKRWQNLWNFIPKLSFDDRNSSLLLGGDYTKFIYFVEKSMLLHKASVLRGLKLQLSPSCSSEQIALWIRLAVYRNVRNLTIKLYSYPVHVRLPNNLCTSKALVVLKLKNIILQDIHSSACFKSLKTLHLKYLMYSGDESPSRFISSCPSLQNLVVKRHLNDNVRRFEIKVRYLQSLNVSMLSMYGEVDVEVEAEPEPKEYVVDTPNLKSLKILDCFTDLCSFQEMNQLEEANLEAEFTCSKEFFTSLRYSKKLFLCLKKLKIHYFKDIVFSRLNTLEICTCDDENWFKLLMCLLNASPDLRVLKLQMNLYCKKTESLYLWDEPSYVPECLSKTLESLEFRDYGGTSNDRKLFKYILKNATSLKKSIFYPVPEFAVEISQSIEQELQSFSLISVPLNLNGDFISNLKQTNRECVRPIILYDVFSVL